MFGLALWLSIAAAPGVAAASGGPAPWSSLNTELTVIDGRRVNVVLSNAGDAPVTVLTRDTPFDRLTLGPSLVIAPAGVAAAAPVPYRGRQAKRLPPGLDELLQLAPGESVDATVPLWQGWRVPQDGSYRVALARPWRVAHASPQALTARSLARSERLDLGFVDAAPAPAIEAALFAGAIEQDLVPRLRPSTYTSCSAAQQNEIAIAAATAERLVTQSASDVRSLSVAEAASSPRMRTWFGAYDAERYANASNDLDAIAAALANETLGFNCDCSDAGVFAYVFPNRPHETWLCPAFWNAALEGTDSRAGTIVHELSHFDVVAGTDDHVYTQQRAQNLAISNPTLAIDNADSFEYFVENTPPLELRGDGTLPPDDAPPPGAAYTDSGSLAQGTALDYQVGSGTQATVESLTGDADLFVYFGNAASESELACVSNAASGPDSCPLTGNGPWLVRVVGYTDTDYRLTVAGAGERPSDDDPNGGAAGGGGAAAPLGMLALLALALRRRVQRRVQRPAFARGALALALSGAVLGSGCAAAGAPAVDVQLAPVVAAEQGNASEVRVQLHNAGSQPIELLLWNTPFEAPLSADLFEVSNGGEPVRYVGRLVKRGTPPAEAWTTLAPGEQIDAVIDLAQHYQLSAPGTYEVALRVPVIDGVVRFNESTPVRVIGDSITLAL